MTNSSWKVGQWTTPTTTVTVTPVPSEVTSESKTQISHNIAGQFPQFVSEDYPTFIDFVKEYYKSQELRGYCFDIINNWSDYYNIDNYGDLVTETKLISAVTTSSTAVDVESTRDFPSEGLLLIDDEIIYYQSKGSTIFNDCARGFDAIRALGKEGIYKFEETTAATHDLGATVVNLNNIFPLYVLGKFKEQFLATYPKNFADGVTESTIVKRIKDFYASKGSTRSFQFVLRTLFGVESEVSYPRDRIFKPSDAYYTSREVIRAVAVSGDPTDLVGQVLYQENDANDPNVAEARIYVKGVVEVFTASGSVFEIDVDTNNSTGTFVTPYKTTLSADVGGNITDTVITVDSTLGWPQENGRFRIEDEIISYTDKTVNQFLGCNRARENTLIVAHDAGQEVFAAFKIYGESNVDGSTIQLKVYGGTRGVVLTDGGKYYLPNSKVTTPIAPGFDSIDPVWDSFQYNIRRALRGVSATLGTVAANGSVRCTVVTKEKHRLRRDDIIRILNAPEDIYNNQHDVVGIIDENTFEFIFSTSPASGITNFEFYIAREFAYGNSDYSSIKNIISPFLTDVQNTYKSATDVIVASAGIPSHKIGPFAAGDLNPGNQRYLKRIPATPRTKSTKTATPSGQVGISAVGVPFFSYKGKEKDIKKYGGIRAIDRLSGGTGYDVTNPPTVQFEPDYKLGENYSIYTKVKHNGNRYKALNTGVASSIDYPTHTTGTLVVGTVSWEYEGVSAAATVTVNGSLTAVNITDGGSGYLTEPIVSVIGGGATAGNQATATAQITSGKVTGITVSNGGTGYTSVPTIAITGGSGTGATATATCRGSIDTINITNAGSQYTYEPTIDLISGSGAVAYPSILNGKIESIIVTFGGSGYFGAPDVVILGDGVGATAFAVVDPSTNIVTGVTITNKGAGYSAGATTVSIVYPGSGASFQTKLTELSFNEAATGAELSDNTFVSRKTTDSAGGGVFQGENYLIYGGEYGYLYNPKKLRFLLRDNIDENLVELTPTKHSPIIGWAYDGHPIYGPYGFADPENTSPYNSYKLMISSYRVKTTRDALLSGLSDPMGTYIEDYEYLEGLGDLDQYNGRFCVTPEYPNGVYAYFSTIKGSAGEPAFPYFVGPNFYSEAEKVNWDGNGLQKNFTEDATRYKAPYIGTDNIVAKRKQLDNKVDFFLSLEDTTTLIVMETGEILTYLEDGIGYYSYYPVIRGGTADSLVVSSTNKYSSAGVDQYLIEGGGSGYKVNDRLTFDNTGTGGEGISATVSEVTGGTVNSLGNFVGAYNDLFVSSITTADNHYLQVGDAVTVSLSNNAYERTLTSKIIGSKYYFKYFSATSMKLLAEYANSTAYTEKDLIFAGDRVYEAKSSGTSGTSAPTHESGEASDGSMVWVYVRRRTDGNLYQGGWSSITGGSNYLDGTYSGVPLSTNGSGKGGKATIVVSGGAVTTVTITSAGTAYAVGDTISAANVNLGNNLTPSAGSGFTITLTEVETEARIQTDLAHQVGIGDIVNISGITPSGYNKTDYSVVRTETLRKFTVKRNFATIAVANIASAEIYVQEPKLQLILGHKYKFDTSDASNVGKTLAFTLDSANTDVFTYKNVTDEVKDTITGDQTSITILVKDLPGIFYYFDIEGSISGSYFTAMNDPVSGSQTVASRTDTAFSYYTALAPESGYTSGVTYSTNSIFPSGGIATISIGDPGRNYSSLPKLSGSSRAGSGATAEATISGNLAQVIVANAGSGYNNNALPTGVVTLPDFVDLTLTSVFGAFIKNEIVISQTVQGNQTARGQVISWDPTTSVLRIKPLKNTRTGAANKGYIMFSIGGGNTGFVYSSDSQGTVSAVSGIQATVATSVTGGGQLQTVTVTSAGSNYRSAPDVIFDDPYYGIINSVGTINESVSNAFTANQTTTGVTQTSVAPVNGTGAEFTVITDNNGAISSVTCTDGGVAYALGDVITFDGTKLPGGASNEDFTVTVDGLSHANPATITTTLDAAVDAITVTNAGSGYLSAPTVTVSGGNGINAKFNTIIINQTVATINIENAGVQYQSAPVVNISQETGKGASILLKSSDMGKIQSIGGDNITFNYSHDITLKPELNTTYNLQLTRTQVIDYLDVVNGGANFVATPEIVLVGGQGSLFELNAVVENEVIQSVEVIKAGRGFTSGPAVEARVTHTWVGLASNSTLNFPYNPKVPNGTKVYLTEDLGQFPAPLTPNTAYYVIAPTTGNGLADNQVALATSLANANLGIAQKIVFTSAPVGDGQTGQTYFTMYTSDLGDIINAYMKPATFSIGERLYQGASNTSYTAYGYVKNWDASGRVVSVEIVEGEFKVGEPVFGEETSAFGQIHAFDRADSVFDVSPISTSAAGWERTTGFLDLNEQRVYDSDRYQEFSYNISSSININDWKSPLKFAAHPAGFKVVGTQVLSQATKKSYRAKPTINLSAGNTTDWWVYNTNSMGTTFNGTTYVIPKPSAKATGKLATINNFALGKADYSAAVPTEVQVYGRQLLDIQKILSCISYKIDDISDRTISFDGSSSSIVDTSTNRVVLTNHGLVDNQRIIYNSGGDRFQDARDLIIKNIDYIVEETIGTLNAAYPSLSYNSTTCARDTRLVVAAWANDLRYGGNYFTVDATNKYVGNVVSQSNAHIDAANLLKDNKNLIAAEAVYQMLQDPTVGIASGYPGVPGGDQNCIDDIVDVIEAIAYNLRYGGNSEVWDAANFYVNTVHLDSEETQAVWAFNKAKEYAASIIINTPITIQGTHGYTQTTNTSVTYIAATCASVDAAMDTLFNIVTTAINSDSLASVTRTNPANHISHVGGEEIETIFAYNTARDLCNLAIVNNLPTGTYTAIQPVKDLSITVAPDSCATVTSSITTLAKIITDGIDNPSTVPTVNTGNYPNVRTGTPITGLTNGSAYYIKYVDANTIELRTISGGASINLTGLGTGVGHSVRMYIDGINDSFRIRTNGIDIGTQIAKTADKKQLFVITNGIVTNPATYSFSSNILTFNIPPLAETKVLCMYYDRATYADSFQLDQIGDEVKTFDVANGLTPGYGYTNGTYTNIPLKNRLGSGSGATADITVAGKKVTNVVLNAAGNGYTENDVLGLSEIGSQLTINYAPSAAAYAPSTGVLELTIGSHSMLAPTTHTAGSATTYDPKTGYLVIALAGHGFTNGEKVKLDDGAITFTCTQGGGTHAYPRSTDPISDKWVPIFDVTDDTFTIQVLDTVPSTNTTVHTWSASASNAIKHARSYIRIANGALIFSCTEAAGNHTYPRSTDPIGNLFDTPIDAVTSTTITVNALNGTTATNTTTHTFQGLSTYQFQPTKIKYIPATGDMVCTVAGHGLIKGDRIQFANDSLTFTCTKDNNTTNHTYPRAADPAGGAWLTISEVTTNSFKVNVGENQRFQFTPTNSTYTASTGVLTLTIGDHSLLGAVSHTPTDAVYTPADGKVVITVAGHGMSNGDMVLLDDGALTFSCTEGPGNHSYPRATDPISGKFVEIFDVATDTFTIQCLETIPSTNVTTHAFQSAVANSIKQAQDVVTIEENGLIFTCEMDKRATQHSYPRKSDPAYKAPLGIYSVTSDTVTLYVGKTPLVNYTPTNAIYEPTKGEMELVIGSHNLVSGQTIKLADNSISLSCERDNHRTVHTYPRTAIDGFEITGANYNPNNGVMTVTSPSHGFVKDDWVKFKKESLIFTCAIDGNTAKKVYPRTTDFAHDRWLKVSNVTSNTFDVTVLDNAPSTNTSVHTFIAPGKLSPSFAAYDPTTGVMTVTNERFNLSNATYDPASGDMELHIGTHDLTTLDTIRIVPNSMTFSCLAAVGTHTFVSCITNGIVANTSPVSDWTAQAGTTYDPTTGLMVIEIGSHSLTTSNKVSFSPVGCVTFTCDADNHATEHSYPRSTDPAGNGAIMDIDAVTATTITVNVGIASSNNQSTYPRATGANTTSGADYAYEQSLPVKSFTSNTITVNVNKNATTPISINSAHTFINATAHCILVGHGLDNGDHVKVDDEAFSFSCTQGLGTHKYPRAAKTLLTAKAPGNTFDVDSATYDPATGLVTLDFNSTVHGLNAPTTHQATAGAYVTSTGIMTLTITGHGWNNGDLIKIDDNALSFSCTHGGGGTSTYPRSTDPISGKWIEIFNVTTNTFDVQVLDKIPSTNLTDHTFVSCTGTGISYARAVVRLLPNSLSFTCAMDGNVATKTYPRPSDPYFGKDMAVTAVPATDQLTIFVGKSPVVNHTATDGTYDPITGALTLEIGSHDIEVGNTVKLTNQGFTFQCATDNYATDHQYPRANGQGGATGDDPAYNTAVTITGVTDTSITLNVGASPDTSTHRWKSGFTATNAIQSGGGYAHTWTGGTSAAVCLFAAGAVDSGSTGTSYYPETGILHIQTTVDHGMNDGDYIKLDDGSLTFNCAQGAGSHSYPRSTDPVSGKWLRVFNTTPDEFDVKVLDTIPSTNVTMHKFASSVTNGITVKDPLSGNFVDVSNVTYSTFDIQVLTEAPSTNITTHTFLNADANSITIAPIKKKVDPFYDTALDILATTSDSITVKVLNTSQSTSTFKHKFHSALSNAVIAGGNYTHKFISANAGAVKSGDRHTFVSATSTAVTRGIVTTGVYEYDKGADAGSLMRDNQEFIATTAYGRMILNNPGFTVPSYAKCIRDTKLIVDAVADNIEFGGNDATYDAANYYVSTVHLTGEEDESVQVFNAARDICREVMRNITVTTNSYTRGDQIKDLTITNDSGNSVYDTNDCQDVASSISTLFNIVTTAVGTTAGGSGNLNSVTRTKSSAPDFQIKVGDVTFDGTDTTFTAKVGGSTQVLPASDNFLIFLNSTLQVKGSTDAYTYTGSTLTFTEAPIPGMDFYGFYLGKLTLLDDLAPYFDNSKKNFTMKSDNEPFSLESDNSAVVASNNLLIFINGVFQEPGIAYDLRGSIIEFSEAPRAGSECALYIYTGSASDVLISNTFNSIDPGDRVQVVSEGTDRLIATVSSSTSIDSYEYTGLKPTPAEFVATLNAGKVSSVQITNPGSNYEVPPILYFQGGGGEGASAQTTIEVGSGKVLSVINLEGGNNYTQVPSVLPVHPIHIERKQRNRIISNSSMLAVSYLTSSITDTSTTLNLKNVWYDVSQKNGFPDEAEILIQVWDGTIWTTERILYGAKDVNANTLTVATGGRGYGGTTARANTIVTGTYSSTGTTCTVTTGSAHNLVNGMSIFLDHTTGDGFDGSYIVSNVTSNTFTVTYPFSRTASGNVSLLPEVRLRSL